MRKKENFRKGYKISASKVISESLPTIGVKKI
jgi:hypothetical protein